MGSSLNRQSQSNDSAVFVIPNYINLTPHQHALLTEAGQQPGVPFRIMNDGAERPQGERRKISIADNFVNLRKSSVALIEDSKRKYAISFSYDAKVKCRATIYLGAKDKTNGQTIRIGSALLLWGPFELQSGINCTWSSKYENCFAEESSLPGMYCKTAPDTFDIIIILDPSEAISNIRERRRKDVDRDREKRLSTGGGGGLSTSLFPIHLNNNIIPPSYNYNKDVLMQASYLKILGYGEANFDRNKLTLLYQKVMLASGVYLLQELYGIDQNNNHDKNNNISLKKSPSQRSSSSQRHSFVSSTSTVMVDINGNTSKQQQQHSSTTPTTPVNTLKNGKISLNINIFSKRPVVATTPASASASPSSQDNLTINPNSNKANDANTSSSSSSSLTSLQPLKAINNYMSTPTTATVTSPNQPDHEAYDTDSNECVICLTDPKEVAVFPCRHMCLCETCAEALPSQGNKCPICRREACLLLRVHNLMARNGVENPP